MWTDERRKQQAERMKKYREANPELFIVRGRPMSLANRKKLILANKTRVWTPEMRAAMRAKFLGDKSANWKGGRHNDRGYVLVHAPNHPRCPKPNMVYEHRLVMEKHLGRYLTSEEVVHHINEDKADNRIENLMLFPSHATHIAHHEMLKRQNAKTH